LLRPQDEIILKSIFDLEESYKVFIEGAVQKEGEYPWKKDLRVKDLIFLAGGLKNEAFMEKIMIYRLNKNQSFNIISFDLKDNKLGEFTLEANDKVIIKSEKDLSIPKYVTIYGEIKEPGIFPYADNLTLEDLILLSKGYTEGATQMNIEITRRKEGIDPFNIKAELSESITVEIPSSSLNKMENEILLKPFDVITIRKNPLIQNQNFVEIKGQLLFPGKYALQKKDERISSLFFRAGGSLPEANLKGAKLIRKMSNDFSMYYEAVKNISDNFGLDSINQVITEKKEFKEIAIDLLAALKNPGSKDDVFLEPEDILMIPRQSNLIMVEGEVFNPVGLPFATGKRADYFIKLAGGFKEEAMRKKTFVIFPDGSAKSTIKVLGLINKFPRVEPGTFVVVPKMPPSDGTRKFNIADLTLASSTIAGISTFILGIVQLLK
jgi:protein involved in polysaccharide export with SLBB domain